MKKEQWLVRCVDKKLFHQKLNHNHRKLIRTKSNVHSVVRQMLGRLHSLTGLWDRYSLDLIHLIMVSNGTVGIVIASFRGSLCENCVYIDIK